MVYFQGLKIWKLGNVYVSIVCSNNLKLSLSVFVNWAIDERINGTYHFLTRN